jgi:hypothetical protein
MSGIKHTIAVLLAIGLAYFWLITPVLSYYSVQAFAMATLGFFLSKRLTKAQIWHILPTPHSFELVFISFAITILVGSTGNVSSIFYPFVYIHLFFLVMTSRQITAVAATVAVMLVHYALEPEVTSLTIASFTTLPLMLAFFLFARRQYDDSRLQHKLIKSEEKNFGILEQKEQSLESFISNFLLPKLSILKDLVETCRHRGEPIDAKIIDTQISLITSESQKIIMQQTNKTEKKPEQ